jgi:hypothetical protein
MREMISDRQLQAGHSMPSWVPVALSLPLVAQLFDAPNPPRAGLTPTDSHELGV